MPTYITKSLCCRLFHFPLFSIWGTSYLWAFQPASYWKTPFLTDFTGNSYHGWQPGKSGISGWIHWITSARWIRSSNGASPPRPRNISQESLNHFNFVGFHLGWCSCDPVQWLWPNAQGSIWCQIHNLQSRFGIELGKPSELISVLRLGILLILLIFLWANTRF